MFLKSIRWRLQAWLAYLLVCTLSGFALATFEAHRAKQFQAVDVELSRRLDSLAMLNRGRMGPWGRPPFEDRRGPEPPWERRGGGPPGPFDDFGRRDAPPWEPGGGFPPDRPGDRRRPGPGPGEGTNAPPVPALPALDSGPPPALERLIREDLEKGIYFVVWNRDSSRLSGSTNVPPELVRPAPQPADSGPHRRTRDRFREVYDFNREGRCVLVGRSIAPELEAMRSLAVALAAAGAAVLALGLGGGWWITGRALRPIQEISATARRISAGNLSERINVEDTENELGQLAGVLNSTFARLETAFAQQRQFTADASHELRTPIAVIIAEAQTALARQRTAAEYRETLEGCLDTAQQMRRLAQSLLELARYDAGLEAIERRPFDLAAEARAALDLVRPLAVQQGVELAADLHAVTAQGDASRLGQVVTNLLTNAVRFTPAQGRVRVATAAADGQAILTVADSGEGIPAQDLPRIFERFYRVDSSRGRASGGAGLGLAICKAIVDAHGGGIEVTSEVGRGTTFTVRLPAG